MMCLALQNEVAPCGPYSGDSPAKRTTDIVGDRVLWVQGLSMYWAKGAAAVMRSAWWFPLGVALMAVLRSVKSAKLPPSS